MASKSAGQKFAAKLDKPREQEAVALGEALFYRRSGPFDFACATCHAQSGLRIRLQGLPYSRPEGGEQGHRRVAGLSRSTTHVMTMQHRLLDCYWQMRMPELQLGSDASVALIVSHQSGRGRRNRRSRPEALSAGDQDMRQILPLSFFLCCPRRR